MMPNEIDWDAMATKKPAEKPAKLASERKPRPKPAPVVKPAPAPIFSAAFWQVWPDLEQSVSSVFKKWPAKLVEWKIVKAEIESKR